MMIKQQGGVFGRNPTFKNVTADNVVGSTASFATLQVADIQIGEDITGGFVGATKLFTNSGAGTQTLTVTAAGVAYGYFDVAVFGTYGATNREGYAAYRIYWNRGNADVVTVAAPINNSGDFTTGFNFVVTAVNDTVFTIAISKGSGATFTVYVDSRLSQTFTLASSFA